MNSCKAVHLLNLTVTVHRLPAMKNYVAPVIKIASLRTGALCTQYASGLAVQQTRSPAVNRNITSDFCAL